MAVAVVVVARPKEEAVAVMMKAMKVKEEVVVVVMKAMKVKEEAARRHLGGGHWELRRGMRTRGRGGGGGMSG